MADDIRDERIPAIKKTEMAHSLAYGFGNRGISSESHHTERIARRRRYDMAWRFKAHAGGIIEARIQ